MDDFNDDREGLEEMASALKGENVELLIIGLDNTVDAPSDRSDGSQNQPGPSNRCENSYVKFSRFSFKLLKKSVTTLFCPIEATVYRVIWER